MKEVRCERCGKLLLLAKVMQDVEIKCTRCKHLNKIETFPVIRIGFVEKRVQMVMR